MNICYKNRIDTNLKLGIKIDTTIRDRHEIDADKRYKYSYKIGTNCKYSNSLKRYSTKIDTNISE